MSRRKRNRPPLPKATELPGVSTVEWHAPVCLALILLATFVVYSPAMNGGQILDDADNITKPELRSIGGLYRIWFDPASTPQYYPFVHTVFWLEHKLFGDSYLGYHLLNVAWHALAAVLLYIILARLKIPGALWAAAIFALHPVMVESVAWMTEQKNTLSTVFYLGAMLVYLGYDESRRPLSYFLALVLFALALMTKTNTFSLPFALLVIFWWQRGTLSWRHDLLPLVPFFAFGVASGLITILVERTYFRTGSSELVLTPVERFLLAGRALWFYFAKLVWPTNLAFSYARWTLNPSQWWQWIYSPAALAATFFLWKIRNRWRAPLAAWLLFCGTLFPVLGFLNVYMFVYTFVADHLQYLASVGLIVLATAGFALGLARLPQSIRTIGMALGVLIVGTLSVLTLRQSKLYGDPIALYRDTIERNPDCWMAHNDLAMELDKKGDREAALRHYEMALHIKPDYYEGRTNRGATLNGMGRFSDAIDEYHEALRLEPNYFSAHHNLGTTTPTNVGQFPEAITEFEAALALNENDPNPHNGLAIALMSMGRYREAIEHLNRALQLRPDFTEAFINLGSALTQENRLPEAIAKLESARVLSPDNPLVLSNLGIALARSGRFADAIDRLQQVARLQPDQAVAHSNLGFAFQLAGNTHQAIEHYRAALKLDPNNPLAYANLARNLATARQSEEAIATARQGIDVARRGGQPAMADKIQQWLTNYQKEPEVRKPF